MKNIMSYPWLHHMFCQFKISPILELIYNHLGASPHFDSSGLPITNLELKSLQSPARYAGKVDCNAASIIVWQVQGHQRFPLSRPFSWVISSVILNFCPNGGRLALSLSRVLLPVHHPIPRPYKACVGHQPLIKVQYQYLPTWPQPMSINESSNNGQVGPSHLNRMVRFFSILPPPPSAQ